MLQFPMIHLFLFNNQLEGMDGILFELAEDCISAVAFNAVFAELVCVVEVTGSDANNAKAWHENVSVEDTWTFTARE